MYRDHTKTVKIGNRVIGGGNPVLIQSMTNTKTEDVEATVDQINRLDCSGMRHHPLCGADHGSGTRHLRRSKSRSHIPLVADIHFDYQTGDRCDGERERTRSGSIREISEVRSVMQCRRGCWQRNGISRSGSGSTAVLWKKRSGGKRSWCDRRRTCGECAAQVCSDRGYGV